MSIPNEALQKVVSASGLLTLPMRWLTRSQLVEEIESQAVLAQREISLVKAAVSTKQRDIRMLELTGGEVKQLSKDTKLYEGVGKMSVLHWGTLIDCT